MGDLREKPGISKPPASGGWGVIMAAIRESGGSITIISKWLNRKMIIEINFKIYTMKLNSLKVAFDILKQRIVIHF